MQRRLLLLSLGLAVMTYLTSALPVHAAETPRRIEVTAERFEFDPAVITLKKGEPIMLVLTSLDVPHGLRFRELGVEVKSSKGKPGHVVFTPDRTGEFVGHCSVFCGAKHGRMMLTLHVVN